MRTTFFIILVTTMCNVCFAATSLHEASYIPEPTSSSISTDTVQNDPCESQRGIDKLIQCAIDKSINNVWGLVAALAGVGIFSMALIEIFRLIFQPRMFLNQMLFKWWLNRASGDALGFLPWWFLSHVGKCSQFKLKIDKCWESRLSKDAQAESEIVKLSIGGSYYLLYSLPVERMIGQINTAVQIALAYPKEYKKIIKSLALENDKASDNDINETLKKDINTVFNGPPQKIAKSSSPTPDEYNAARTRVANTIQRNLDNLQILINGIWNRGMQATAVIVSIILILVFIRPEATEEGNVIKWALFAIFGGMVAPVAKDILSSLKKVKERPR